MAAILLIDDDDAFREGLSETLSDLGHETVCAALGERAIALICDCASPLDLRPNMFSGSSIDAHARGVFRSNRPGHSGRDSGGFNTWDV